MTSKFVELVSLSPPCCQKNYQGLDEWCASSNVAVPKSASLYRPITILWLNSSSQETSCLGPNTPDHRYAFVWVSSLFVLTSLQWTKERSSDVRSWWQVISAFCPQDVLGLDILSIHENDVWLPLSHSCSEVRTRNPMKMGRESHGSRKKDSKSPIGFQNQRKQLVHWVLLAQAAINSQQFGVSLVVSWYPARSLDEPYHADSWRWGHSKGHTTPAEVGSEMEHPSHLSFIHPSYILYILNLRIFVQRKVSCNANMKWSKGKVFVGAWMSSFLSLCYLHWPFCRVSLSAFTTSNSENRKQVGDFFSPVAQGWITTRFVHANYLPQRATTSIQVPPPLDFANPALIKIPCLATHRLCWQSCFQWLLDFRKCTGHFSALPFMRIGPTTRYILRNFVTWEDPDFNRKKHRCHTNFRCKLS